MLIESITKDGAIKEAVGIQLVTFELGTEIYGVDIMKVLEIHPWAEIRSMPHSPAYVLGIFNLRGEIIPIISLHTRFHITSKERDKNEDSMSGFVIFSIGNTKMGVLIDKILRVITVLRDEIVQTPQIISGMGLGCIQGIVKSKVDGGKYLVILEMQALFNKKELDKLRGYHRQHVDPVVSST